MLFQTLQNNKLMHSFTNFKIDKKIILILSQMVIFNIKYKDANKKFLFNKFNPF